MSILKRRNISHHTGGVRGGHNNMKKRLLVGKRIFRFLSQPRTTNSCRFKGAGIKKAPRIDDCRNAREPRRYALKGLTRSKPASNRQGASCHVPPGGCAFPGGGCFTRKSSSNQRAVVCSLNQSGQNVLERFLIVIGF